MSKTNKYQIRKKRRDRKSFERNRWIRMWQKMPLRFHEYAKTLDVIITPGQKEAALKLIGMDVAAGGDCSETVVQKHRAFGIIGHAGDRADALAHALMGRQLSRGAVAIVDEPFDLSMIREEDLEIMKKRMLDRIIHSCGMPPRAIDAGAEFKSGEAIEAERE